MAITFKFKWDEYVKPGVTMLIGTSPQLEIALYTLCFRLRPGEACPVSLAGRRFIIFTKISRGGYLRSAYFVNPRWL